MIINLSFISRFVTALLFSYLALSYIAHADESNTTFKVGGMIKVDAMLSQYSDAQRAGNVGDDFLVPSTIPTGDGSAKGDAVYDSSAKLSRIWFKSLTTTPQGNVASHIEMDFNGASDERLTNQSSAGVRHAYLNWQKSDQSSILAGLSWSTFFNVAALPEAVDFVGPTSGAIFMRQSQLRYTQKLSSGKMMFSFENPSVSLYDGGSGYDNNQVDNSALPDLIARYDGSAGQLKYSAAAMLRQISYNTGASDDSQIGYGATFSGAYSIGNGDSIKFMLSNGNLGRYIALNAYRDGVVEANGDIELINVSGGFVAYRHLWSEKLRSNFIYAYSTADNPNTVVADVTKTASNANVNLMYSPLKKLTFGIEYMMAQRELESGTDGDFNRLQMTSKWVF